MKSNIDIDSELLVNFQPEGEFRLVDDKARKQEKRDLHRRQLSAPTFNRRGNAPDKHDQEQPLRRNGFGIRQQRLAVRKGVDERVQEKALRYLRTHHLQPIHSAGPRSAGPKWGLLPHRPTPTGSKPYERSFQKAQIAHPQTRHPGPKEFPKSIMIANNSTKAGDPAKVSFEHPIEPTDKGGHYANIASGGVKGVIKPNEFTPELGPSDRVLKPSDTSWSHEKQAKEASALRAHLGKSHANYFMVHRLPPHVPGILWKMFNAAMREKHSHKVPGEWGVFGNGSAELLIRSSRLPARDLQSALQKAEIYCAKLSFQYQEVKTKGTYYDVLVGQTLASGKGFRTPIGPLASFAEGLKQVERLERDKRYKSEIVSIFSEGIMNPDLYDDTVEKIRRWCIKRKPTYTFEFALRDLKI